MIVFTSTVDLTGDAGQCAATRSIFLALHRTAGDRSVHLICPEPERPEMLAQVDGDRLHLLPAKRRRSWTWSARGQLHMARHLLGLLTSGRVSAVVGRLSASLVAPPILARGFGVPFLLLARGMGPRFPLPGVSWLNARLATEVYAAFEAVREKLGPHRPEGRPIQLFRNAADPELFRPRPREQARARADVRLPEDAFLVGFVGSMEAYHRVDALIGALAHLRAEGMDDARLLLVGDGPVRGELEAMVEDLGLDEAVVFTGWVDQREVPRLVAACDVLYGAIALDRLGSPLKCYEYLACERPVVVADSEEFAFVEEIGAGLAVEEVTPEAVADALRELRAADPARRRAMGRAGRAHVVEHHTWDRLARRMLADVERHGAEPARG